MNTLLIIIVLILLPTYFICDARWQNVILFLMCVSLIQCFLPGEACLLFLTFAALYILGFSLIKYPSTKWLIIFCVLIGAILLFIREEHFVARSVISFLFLNSVAFLFLCLKQNKLPPFIESGLYILYFPKLICGPYEKTNDFLGVLRRQRCFSFLALLKGTVFIVLGLLERFAFAGNISYARDRLLNATSHFSITDFLIVGVLTGFELFFIISAFTNWAKGSSIILGIPISENFRFPFMSSSFSDYWRRWHISIHSWLKDFIYQPLMMKGNSFLTCLLITFLISAIWHSPILEYLVWGVVASVLIFLEKMITLPVNLRCLRIPLVFLATSMLWIFFLNDSIEIMMSKNIQASAFFDIAYPSLIITGIIALVFSMFCDVQSRLIEKQPFHYLLPVFLVDLFLLLILWPGSVSTNSIYGF